MENRIKECIKKAGISQKELAEKMDMTPIGLNFLANSTMPKIETFEKVARAIGLPVWRLILSDDEIEAIQSIAPPKNSSSDNFCCPKCGAALKVVPADE